MHFIDVERLIYTQWLVLACLDLHFVRVHNLAAEIIVGERPVFECLVFLVPSKAHVQILVGGVLNLLLLTQVKNWRFVILARVFFERKIHIVVGMVVLIVRFFDLAEGGGVALVLAETWNFRGFYHRRFIVPHIFGVVKRVVRVSVGCILVTITTV